MRLSLVGVALAALLLAGCSQPAGPLVVGGHGTDTCIPLGAGGDFVFAVPLQTAADKTVTITSVTLNAPGNLGSVQPYVLDVHIARPFGGKQGDLDGWDTRRPAVGSVVTGEATLAISIAKGTRPDVGRFQGLTVGYDDGRTASSSASMTLHTTC